MHDQGITEYLTKNLLDPIGPSEYILSGPAGTGKTTFIRQLVMQALAARKKVMIICPTNKSICNLVDCSDVLQRLTKTYASFFKCTFDLLEEDDCLRCMIRCCDRSSHSHHITSVTQCLRSSKTSIKYDLDILIVEEASMFNHQYYMLLQLCSGITSILFVGDSNQIPPITENCIECLKCSFSVFSTPHEQLILKEQKRHCGNLQVQLQTFIRSVSSFPNPTAAKIRTCLKNIFPVIPLSDALPLSAPILTYHVNTALQINYLLTNSRRELQTGDLVTVDQGSIDSIPVGSLVLIKTISKNFYNCIKLERGFNFITYGVEYKNEHYEINTISPSDEVEYISHCRELRKNKKIGDKFKINKLVQEHLTRLNFGYSITAHKAQGQTYRTSYIAFEDILSCGDKSMLVKLLYSTISRAKENVVLVTIPDHYKSSECQIIDSNFCTV